MLRRAETHATSTFTLSKMDVKCVHPRRAGAYISLSKMGPGSPIRRKLGRERDGMAFEYIIPERSKREREGTEGGMTECLIRASNPPAGMRVHTYTYIYAKRGQCLTPAASSRINIRMPLDAAGRVTRIHISIHAFFLYTHRYTHVVQLFFRRSGWWRCCCLPAGSLAASFSKRDESSFARCTFGVLSSSFSFYFYVAPSRHTGSATRDFYM